MREASASTCGGLFVTTGLKKIMRKKTSKRGMLVKNHLEHRKWEDYKIALDKKHRGRGIYVLYKDGEIYYIGLSKSSLKSRLRRHALRDRHKGRWDSFSFYQIGKTRFINDVESLFIRVCNPPGNRIGGRKWHKRYDLKNKIINN